MFRKKMKRMDTLDVGLIKWASIVFALFVVSVWPAFANWVVSVHWGWFLGVALILSARPLYKFCRRK